jgi:DNA-binding HxlR family transcriptional regulator
MPHATPTSGQPVRGSTTGRPLMAALDLLGRRWALRVLWELRDGPLGARELRRRCDSMSTSVLYERLRELSAANLIVQSGDQYDLTDHGRSLGAAITALDTWAQGWASSANDHDELTVAAVEAPS